MNALYEKSSVSKFGFKSVSESSQVTNSMGKSGQLLVFQAAFYMLCLGVLQMHTSICFMAKNIIEKCTW